MAWGLRGLMGGRRVSRPLACGLVALAGAMAVGHVRAQTLTEVVRRALETSPALLSAQARVEAAQADVGRARSAHYPQWSLVGNANSFQSGAMPAAVGPRNLLPTAKLNLWSGGRIQAEVEHSQALTQASQAQQAVAQDELALQVTEAYLGWHKLHELQQLAQRNLADHLETLDMIRQIVQVDQGRGIDLKQAQLRVDSAQWTLQQYAAEQAKALVRLQRHGAFVGRSATASGPPPAFSAEALEAVPDTLEAACASVSDDLPILAQYGAQIEAAQAAIQQARGQHWPTVDLLASRQFNPNIQRLDNLTQIQLNMPLYSGRSVEFQVAAAQAQWRAAQAALEEARQVQLEKTAAAWHDWQSAKARSHVGLAQSAQGDAVVQGYRAQFRLARRSLLDLLNIQADVFNYRSNAVMSRYDELIAKARLLSAMGGLVRRLRPDGPGLS